jgi:hypothetical protein
MDTADLFRARLTDPDTSHIQMGVMGRDENIRTYIEALIKAAGISGMTGNEVQRYMPEEKKQAHNRQMTSLRRNGKLFKIPERRKGSMVVIHADHLVAWKNLVTPEQWMEFVLLEQG